MRNPERSSNSAEKSALARLADKRRFINAGLLLPAAMAFGYEALGARHALAQEDGADSITEVNAEALQEMRDSVAAIQLPELDIPGATQEFEWHQMKDNAAESNDSTSTGEMDITQDNTTVAITYAFGDYLAGGMDSALDDTLLVSHIAVHDLPEHIEVQETGRIHTVSGIGSTAEEAVVSALSEAATAFSVDIESTHIDRQSVTEQGGDAEVVASVSLQTAKSIITSYDVIQIQPGKDEKEFTAMVKVVEGAVQ